MCRNCRKNRGGQNSWYEAPICEQNGSKVANNIFRPVVFSWNKETNLSPHEESNFTLKLYHRATEIPPCAKSLRIPNVTVVPHTVRISNVNRDTFVNRIRYMVTSKLVKEIVKDVFSSLSLHEKL